MIRIKFLVVCLGIILFTSVVIINCSDDNIVAPVQVDSSDFRYPFKDGCTWSYTMTTTVTDIRPDSILHYFTDYPIVTNGTATILYDTAINSVTTKCFLDEFTSSGNLYSNRFYYINNDTALILFAQRRQGPASGIMPIRKNIRINTVYDNLNIIYNNELEVLDDSLHCALKYPMRTGTQWSYDLGGYTTNKEYSGFENVIVPAGTISCMKEIVTYSYSPTGTYYNYYSRSGTIKTYMFINDIAHTTISDPDGDGTFDITQETVVNSFNIPSH